MDYKKFNKFTKEGIIEILIVIKKLGLPFVILGGIFLLYSWIDGKAVVSFRQLIIIFLILVIFQVEFENLWLEKEIDKLKKRIENLEKK
ncbi:hypothetical protein [Paramaledivibacter caminithermalis]|jgi:hypothetical protein|uniref:Uncharacterized protein n=1 Tax=Paramaledivibacter caminithermalis (strain DSM 15212 / CIP 107654 / DViRD3) TaxID=1121301 RepID=A0A1M6KPX1_PARC5|nr:hypothetical protein [Paramaledivibacter caminithermalis]SHJ61009.1 hypothetical protein SAMN02745912_00475 [Paramaledivibacter caminithermalis DSM 15212]